MDAGEITLQEAHELILRLFDVMQSDCDHEDELTTSAQMAQNHLLCDVSFDEDEDFEEDEQSPPDYYQCMCCGNVQSRSYSCNRCAGPMSECWY